MSNSKLIATVANLTTNQEARRQAQRVGLTINSVTWEDCSRYKGSSWGGNISDMTLNVEERNLPVIRYDNFRDKTFDIDINKFNVTVTKGGGKTRVSLREYLDNFRLYSTAAAGTKLLAERDTHLLGSAQACILPLEAEEQEFTVQLYNYQSDRDDPAVLVIVVTAEGTSAQVVNRSSTTLYFDKDGKSAKFLAQRLVEDRRKRGVVLTGVMTQDEQERNAIFLIQVPLKQERRSLLQSASYGGGNKSMMYGEEECVTLGAGGYLENQTVHVEDYAFMATTRDGSRSSSGSGMRGAAPRGIDHAVIRASEKTYGAFPKLPAKPLIRDEDRPIRVTIQFYKGLDTDQVPAEVYDEFAQQINERYDRGIVQGSLVTAGDTGRVTETTHNVTPALPSEAERAARPMFA